MSDSTTIDYYSETFASMSIAYAAAHAEEPTEPGPTYEASVSVNDVSGTLLFSLMDRLSLSQAEFEDWVRVSVQEQITAEATERYVPEETDGVNPYSAINSGDVWRMVEMDSIDFYRNGEAIGEKRIVPIVNAEDAILSEGGQRSLNQEAMNELVAERLATPAGGYERAFKMDKNLMNIIRAYVNTHPEGPNEEHYRDLIYGVRQAAMEAAAEAERAKRKEDIGERLREMGLDYSMFEGGNVQEGASASASATASAQTSGSMIAQILHQYLG